MKKGGKKRSITYDTATTMATKEERRKEKKQANKRGLKKPGEKWRIKDKKEVGRVEARLSYL